MNEMEQPCMKMSAILRCGVALAALAAILAGCTGVGSQMPGQSPIAASLRDLQRSNRVGVVPAQHILKRSWIDPRWGNDLRDPHHKKQKLLYLSDLEYGSLDIVNYKTGAAVGQVAGFEYPYGDCSDKNGNVYVADFDQEEGFEIQAGTTTVINSWPTGGEAIGCSVSNSGDVAFSNFYPGGVKIVAGPDAGASYPGPGYDWPAGYDNKGNLFVMCNYVAPCSNPHLAELPAGSDQWILLNFSASSITFPSGIEWDGKYLAMAAQCQSGNSSCVAQVTVSGSTATVVNTVELDAGGSGCSSYVDLGGSWAEDARNPNGQLKSRTTAIAAANLWCFPSPVLVWPYPAGGPPKRVISLLSPYQYDYGTALIKI